MADVVSYRRESEGISTWAIAEGVALIVLGIITFFAPRASIPTVLEVILPIVLVLKGIFEVIAAFRAADEGGTRYDLAFGIISILAGVALFAAPAMPGISRPSILIGYFLIEGIARIVIGVMVRGDDTGWLWLVGIGIVDLILGVYLWVTPSATVTTFAVLVGLDVIASGVEMAGVGWMERTHHIPAGVTPA